MPTLTPSSTILNSHFDLILHCNICVLMLIHSSRIGQIMANPNRCSICATIQPPSVWFNVKTHVSLWLYCGAQKLLQCTS